MRVTKTGPGPYVGLPEGQTIVNGVGIAGTGPNSEAHNDLTPSNSSGNYSFTEGQGNIASGSSAHAEGNNTDATAYASHSQGTGTLASGSASDAGGDNSQALGDTSFVRGVQNKAHYRQTVLGQFAIDDAISDFVPTVGQKIFKVGWGVNSGSRLDVLSLSTFGELSFNAGFKTDNNSYATRMGDCQRLARQINVSMLPISNIIFESNVGTGSITGTVETTIASFVIPKELVAQYVSNRRLLQWEMKAGINFGTVADRFLINEYWSGNATAMNSVSIGSLTGSPVIQTNQNSALNLWSWTKNQGATNEPLTAVPFRSHMGWETCFANTVMFGNELEINYGQNTWNLGAVDITVTIKGKFTVGTLTSIFYFDFLKAWL